jgi:hypothetical protein
LFGGSLFDGSPAEELNAVLGRKQGEFLAAPEGTAGSK